MQAPSSQHFSSADLQRITAETFIQHLDFLPQVGSTNDRAVELIGRPESDFPLLVLTELQTAGRGRGKNHWWSDQGALTFSVLIATELAQLPSPRWPQVSLATGLAICEALEAIITQEMPTHKPATPPRVQLKWPNDVYVNGQKICGILAEAPPNHADRLLLGIGINVNNSVAAASDELQDTATSLCDLTGQQFSLTEVLIKVLQRLHTRLDPQNLWNAEARQAWQKRCFLTGRKIEIDSAVRKAIGICQGIDNGGALLLDAAGKTERHLSGTITLLE